MLFAVLDDHSRLICHLQWFFAETAQVLVFGLKQALLKWGLPRAIMSDNGSAMIAGETTGGLETLGISHQKTLAYSPHQKGKQETFWSQIEGRLLPMLQHQELDLAQLNRLTTTWAELEYNRRCHQEIDATPLERLQQAQAVSREAPSVDVLDRAFTRRVSRRQRRSDGTLTLDGVRFDVPSRLRMLENLTVRYATWDLTQAYIIDPETDAVLARIRPLDKRKHADGRRAVVEDPSPLSEASEPVDDSYPPLMRKILAQWAQTGLPPAFIPLDPDEDHDA